MARFQQRLALVSVIAAVLSHTASAFSAPGMALPTLAKGSALCARQSEGRSAPLGLSMRLGSTSPSYAKEAAKAYQTHPKDTGSPEYQIASLSSRITYMTAHAQQHRKDKHSLRGLVTMEARYVTLVTNLKIRIAKEDKKNYPKTKK
ncbi:hypothetical protein T484DRAFT_1970604 [Baffinella frigidus]|nr:hypothetical protein T484DRAFT_1970604 [Cryptophyta sp. CCMP2293]